MLTIGPHISIADGLAKAAQSAVEMQAGAMQNFSAATRAGPASEPPGGPRWRLFRK